MSEESFDTSDRWDSRFAAEDITRNAAEKPKVTKKPVKSKSAETKMLKVASRRTASPSELSSVVTQVITTSAPVLRKRNKARKRTNAFSVTDQRPHLPPLLSGDAKKHCLVVDLDETLVHSSFKPVRRAAFQVPVEIDNVTFPVYVMKRPHLEKFLAEIGKMFECVMFTASLSKYADPVTSLLDPQGHVFRHRLFREHCTYTPEGYFVKDLSLLGRQLDRCAIVDNSPVSYLFNPDNAIPVNSWFGDPEDTELLDLIPVLERLARTDSVYTALAGNSAA